jgi:predicted Ser/Thr protein kinase
LSGAAPRAANVRDFSMFQGCFPMATHGDIIEDLPSRPAEHHRSGTPVLNDLLRKVRGYFQAPSEEDGEAHEDSRPRGGAAGGSPPVTEVPTVAIGHRRARWTRDSERLTEAPPEPLRAQDGAAETVALARRAPVDPALAETVASDRTGSASQPAIADEITPDPLLQEAARIAESPDRLTPIPDLQPGQTIGPDRFRVVKMLGRGGFGAVYEAVDLQLRRSVALKVLTHEDGSDEWRRRFRREIIAAAALTHRNIAAVYEAGEDAGRSFAAMELVRGQPLSALLKNGPLPLERVWQIAKEIAAGLAKAHAAQIVHRDIKPGNVLLSEDGEVKLLDFGLAKRMPVDGLKPASYDKITITADARLMGTPPYMSPEQARAANVDFRSDIFSFGILLYEMVTGSRPFRGETLIDLIFAVANEEPPPPSTVDGRTPPELERVILRCLQKLPELRYANAAELLEALERPPPRVVAAHPLAATLLSEQPRRRRRPAWLVPVVGAFVAGAMVAGMAFWSRLAPPPAAPTGNGATPSTGEAEAPPGPTASASAEGPPAGTGATGRIEPTAEPRPDSKPVAGPGSSTNTGDPLGTKGKRTPKPPLPPGTTAPAGPPPRPVPVRPAPAGPVPADSSDMNL